MYMMYIRGYFRINHFSIDFFLKIQSLPKLYWIKTSNNTDGYIRATAHFSVRLKPIDAFDYRAPTLNDKRLIFFLFCICLFFNRRDLVT